MSAVRSVRASRIQCQPHSCRTLFGFAYQVQDRFQDLLCGLQVQIAASLEGRGTTLGKGMFRYFLGMRPGPCGLEDRDPECPPALNSWRAAVGGGALGHERTGKEARRTTPRSRCGRLQSKGRHSSLVRLQCSSTMRRLASGLAGASPLPFGADHRFKVGCTTIRDRKSANQGLPG